MHFSGFFQFQPFLGYLLLLLEIKTKLVKLCTKFQVKRVKFSPSKFSSANQYSESACIFSVRALMVNKTKLSSGSSFIVDVLALLDEKESKGVTKKLCFGALCRNFGVFCSLQNMHICVFPDSFSCFQKSKLTSLNSALNFR